ncbi:hypothetical protein CEX73_00230 [Candidatus Palibaumannia cicadellinicola]|uniref:Uncharacterized protein n=1 Tax=Candidatus Palibaumannia cicadellinicola TaxID=186490 RepID=A0A2N4XXL0_9GAMM|nr:hypothetical protein CEX73_00230 [Candidatus Baumannia cicadellinicola]
MIIWVQAQVFMPNKNYYPIDVNVYRILFDNPLTADFLYQKMRQQAAQQLVHKLLSVHTDGKANHALANTLLPQRMVVSAKP